jgi:hypothetical protein
MTSSEPDTPTEGRVALEASRHADDSYDEHILRQLELSPTERLTVMLLHARAMQRLRASALSGS